MIKYDDTPDTENTFIEATEQIRLLKIKPTNEELLTLYGLYKQATIGNNRTAQPGIFDLKARAKWESWKSYNGESKNWAKDQYVEFVCNLFIKYPS